MKTDAAFCKERRGTWDEVIWIHIASRSSDLSSYLSLNSIRHLQIAQMKCMHQTENAHIIIVHRKLRYLFDTNNIYALCYALWLCVLFQLNGRSSSACKPFHWKWHICQIIFFSSSIILEILSFLRVSVFFSSSIKWWMSKRNKFIWFNLKIFTEQIMLGWRHKANTSSTLTLKRNLEFSMLSSMGCWKKN